MISLPSGISRVQDLTHVLDEDWPVFELYVKPPRIIQLACLADNDYNANELVFNEHIGTHIDAPLHFDDGGLAVHEIAVEDLIAPLCVIRIGDRAAADNITELTVDDIETWERRNGALPERAFVAVDAGWADRVRVPGAFFNVDEEAQIFRFPGVSVEAARFLVERRSVVGVGVDGPSLDTGVRPADPYTHHVLMRAGKYGVECLANLDTLPDRGATLLVGAPKHRGGTGGPARVLALL
ncbi:cyclase family protein [Micromonospora sp. NBC_01699]|uniref:cyclase family protein n=1 Tax=Micromonospora sp. NBC_01699 TaxID=2975984 RepID=UPI002E2FCFB8|nr:cyclase family protein [Micromonospora sp. NBC_01699]